LLYRSFYTCRYNLAIASKSITDEFGFNDRSWGWYFYFMARLD
jgi:hypothetical protein